MLTIMAISVAITAILGIIIYSGAKENTYH